ncbi:hypothetical protein D9613_001369 [Agrocybe pediades]|uniref:Uncharacterized protein n=1 Tax=Agrocybe pediades TaxID=84607 RepID=A0A8H4R6I3_9AGAR|nr:hypothetical protein D9613_001369 [Agrocybe pediades]
MHTYQPIVGHRSVILANPLFFSTNKASTLRNSQGKTGYGLIVLAQSWLLDHTTYPKAVGWKVPDDLSIFSFRRSWKRRDKRIKDAHPSTSLSFTLSCQPKLSTESSSGARLGSRSDGCHRWLRHWPLIVAPVVPTTTHRIYPTKMSDDRVWHRLAAICEEKGET